MNKITEAIKQNKITEAIKEDKKRANTNVSSYMPKNLGRTEMVKQFKKFAEEVNNEYNAKSNK